MDLLGLEFDEKIMVLIFETAIETSLTEVVTTCVGEVGWGIRDLRGAGGGRLGLRNALDLVTKVSDVPGSLGRVLIGRGGGFWCCCSIGGSSWSRYCSGDESQLYSSSSEEHGRESCGLECDVLGVWFRLLDEVLEFGVDASSG